MGPLFQVRLKMTTKEEGKQPLPVAPVTAPSVFSVTAARFSGCFLKSYFIFQARTFGAQNSYNRHISLTRISEGKDVRRGGPRIQTREADSGVAFFAEVIEESP